MKKSVTRTHVFEKPAIQLFIPDVAQQDSGGVGFPRRLHVAMLTDKVIIPQEMP
jgi:hypothetical protein